MTAPAATTPPADASVPGWRGVITLRPGAVAFTGVAGATSAHAHAAVQILLVTGGRVELSDAHGHRRPVRAAIIPTRASHTLHADPDATATMIYLDPAHAAARRLTAHLDDGSDLDHDHVDAWTAAAHAGLPSAGHADHEAGALAALLDEGTARTRHPVLRTATELLPQLLIGPVRLTGLADAVGLSASRLGHLFTTELGLPFPAYLRWVRLRRAVELAQHGASLTQAAHGAGFADSSHLTRVCREMFGLPPSHLLHAIGPHPADTLATGRPPNSTAATRAGLANRDSGSVQAPPPRSS
ncbi:helix-turn-helix transcriptional regulator [Nonomuraea sp. NBC_01738]|uniref:helix-turn-helix transcriptional regulator n=1 Tax=Nonomuraea sp. NBC_01738 TaxID=2976003 RepID=UPI002E14C84B|nr:helix-turn-helix transcriptional regulator [Nonomuraea sp. NBC_01738]